MRMLRTVIDPSRLAPARRNLTVHRSAHPVLRSAPPQAEDPTEAHSTRGASAAEVDAVAHLVETIAPDVGVRRVSRRSDGYLVTASASGRTCLVHVPLDMVPRGRVPDLPVVDRAA